MTFDCLDHNKLQDKMKAIGIHGTTLNWFKSFLTVRTQMVELKHTKKGVTNKIKFRPLPVNRGTIWNHPTWIFFIFTNDLQEYFDNHNTTLIYTDDTVILFSEKLS